METSPDIINCPHCNEFIIIEKINCGIFRHGVYKKTNEQINQHSPKELCDKLYIENLIYGCGKPFSINKINDALSVSKCEYV